MTERGQAVEAPVEGDGKGASVPPDAWGLKRAAAFLGMSPRTLERYVTRRMVPVLVFPPARVEGEGPGSRPMVAFDPEALAEWRSRHAVGARRSA